MVAETSMTANFPREILEMLMPPKKSLGFFRSIVKGKSGGYLYFFPKIIQTQLYPSSGRKNNAKIMKPTFWDPLKMFFFFFLTLFPGSMPVFYFSKPGAFPLLGPNIIFTKTKNSKICIPHF
jgi:hypothetical protein